MMFVFGTTDWATALGVAIDCRDAEEARLIADTMLMLGHSHNDVYKTALLARPWLERKEWDDFIDDRRTENEGEHND